MRILLIDDDKLVCASLKTILEQTGEVSIVAMGHCAEDAIALYSEHLPDVLLMDIRMDGQTGLSAGEAILKKHSDVRILFLTTFADDDYITTALKIGAKGYILKQQFSSILPALKSVCAGQSVFGEEIITKIPQLLQNTAIADLSEFDIHEREMDIIGLVAKGLSNKEIADQLYLSEGTVRNYLSIILEKLDLRDRTQLAIFYLKK